jgi:hypothetical protein
MKYNISKFEFACELFGYNNAIKLKNSYISKFYNDWIYTGLELKQYISLLRVRG